MTKVTGLASDLIETCSRCEDLDESSDFFEDAKIKFDCENYNKGQIVPLVVIDFEEGAVGIYSDINDMNPIEKLNLTLSIKQQQN